MKGNQWKRLRALMALLLAAATLMACTQSTTKQSYVAEGEDGVIYTDLFSGNSAKPEWKVGWDSKISAPETVEGGLLMSGSGTAPCAAMLDKELPNQFDLYFTLDIRQRGGDSRDPGVFFCVDGDYQQRYQILFAEGRLLLRYNGITEVVVKRVAELTAGKAYAVRIAVHGAKIQVFIDGAEEPALKFNASGEFESFMEARHFGVLSYAREAVFDNLVITNGKDLIPVVDTAIRGKDGADTIYGLGNSLQMQAFVNPSNATDRSFVWSVDNEQIATITQDGLLTATGYGTVTVTARTRDGSNLVATCKIRIGVAENVEEDPVISTNRPDALGQISQVVAGEKPGICVLSNGRILVFAENESGCTVSASDDDGQSWTTVLNGDLRSGRLFQVNGQVCLMGADSATGHLVIRVSQDQGNTWSENTVLDERNWSGMPSAAVYSNGYVSLTMEVESKAALDGGFSGQAALAPILMRAKTTADLTDKNSWQFSSELAYGNLMQYGTADMVNFVDVPNAYGDPKTTGWADGNLFQVYDYTQSLYDAQMNTYYIYLHGGAGKEGSQGYAVLLKVKENLKGQLVPSLVLSPMSNKKLMFVPMPGGNGKFSMVYDGQTGLYWLASNYLNEDGRVALWFSMNAYDWCFAGFAAKTESGTYANPTMSFDGKDLLVVLQQNDGNGEQVVLVRVKDYAALVY